MKNTLNDHQPIFLQIKEIIENQIINNQLHDDEKIPSTTELVKFYKVNHITILKGINLLVDEGIIYKKRGVGMFVASGAKEKLLAQRKSEFTEEYLIPMLKEANYLGLTETDLMTLIHDKKGSIKND